MDALYDLREMLCDELVAYGERGELTNATLEKIDTLAHALKNLDKVVECREGGSERTRSRSKRSYSGTHPEEDGRSMKSRRYGRKMHGDDDDFHKEELIDKMYSMMDELPDDKSKEEMQKLVSRMESM